MTAATRNRATNAGNRKTNTGTRGDKRSPELHTQALIEQHLGELQRLIVKAEGQPAATMAEGLTEWLEEVTARGALQHGHHRRLSSRTVEAYRYGAALLAAEVGCIAKYELEEQDILRAFDELSRGSWHSVGTCWQTALTSLGLAEVMPDRSHWANKPQLLTWDPADYDRAFAALHAAYRRARVVRRGGSVAVSSCALLVAALGLRVGEAVSLRWGDVCGEWISVTGKMGSRRVPLTSTAVSILKQVPRGPGKEYVFESRKGSSKPHVRASSVAHHVRRVCDKAKLHHVHTHWLRHAFASWLVRQGYGLPLVARLLGHRSVRTTERYYVHLAKSDQRDAAEALGLALAKGRV